MKGFLIAAVLLFFCLTSYGQNAGGVKVSGQLTDSTGAAVQDANIVFGGKGSSRTTYAVSDANGAFSVTLPAGKYSIGITHISYKDIVEALNITADTTLSYRLTANSNKLSEVKVYGDFIKPKGSGFTAKVRGNPLAEDRSLLSFMNMLPGISGLSVNGRRAVICLNGRELKMPYDELIRYLSSIPTESIEEVSARASKSAALKASGAESTINIVLRKTEDSRYSGQVSLSPSYNLDDGYIDGHAGGTIGYFDKKLSSLTYMDLTKIKEKRKEERCFEDKLENTRSIRTEYIFSLDQSLFYDINSKNSVGLGLNLFHKPDAEENVSYRGDISSPFVKKQSHGIYTKDIFTNYRLVFGKRKSKLSIKADVLSDKYEYSEAYDGISVNKSTSYKDKYLNYGLKTDLLLNLSKDADFNIGAEYISADTRREYNIPFNDVGVDKFKFKESTLGAYMELYTPISVLELNVGLRYEHEFIKRTDTESPHKFLRTWDNGLFPTVTLSYNAKRYRASLYYDRSIYRPRMQSYAPFVSIDGESIMNVSGSLPLQSDTYTSVYFNQTFANEHILRLSYRKVKSGSGTIYLKDGEHLIVTHGQSGWKKWYSLYARPRLWLIKDRVRVDFGITASYSEICNSGKYSHEFSAEGRTSLTYSVPGSCEIMVNGGYHTPFKSLSVKMSESWNCGFAINKKINENWSFRIGSWSLLNSGRTKVTALTPGADYSYLSDISEVNIDVSLVYKFNNFKGKQASKISKVSGRGSD